MLQATGGPVWSGRSFLRFPYASWGQGSCIREWDREEVGTGWRWVGWGRPSCHAQDLALLGDQSCVIIGKPLGFLLKGVGLTLHPDPTILVNVRKAGLRGEGRVIRCICHPVGCGTQASEPSRLWSSPFTGLLLHGSGRVTVYCFNFLKQYCAFISYEHLHSYRSWHFPSTYRVPDAVLRLHVC